MPTDTFGWTYQDSTGNSISGSYSVTANAKLAFDVTLNTANDYSAPGSLTVANVQSVYIQATQNMTLYVNGVNKVQALTPSGTISGGTFTLTNGANTTSALAYNATAATIQAALELLTSIGAGNVVCTGGPINTTAVVATFRKGLACSNTPALSISSSLTGGGSVAISTTTAGVAASQTISLIANAAIDWIKNVSQGTNPLTANWTTGILIANDSGAPGNLNSRILYN